MKNIENCCTVYYSIPLLQISCLFAATDELSWQAGRTHQRVLGFFSLVPGESAPNSAPAARFLSLMAFPSFGGGEMFSSHPQTTRAEFSIAAAEPS